MLDHAYFKGLYLAVVDRRDLSLVESGFFNTTTVPDLYVPKTGAWKERKGEFFYIDDFVTAREMAQSIRKYDYNYFIVVLSQYAWEPFFSKELG